MQCGQCSGMFNVVIVLRCVMWLAFLDVQCGQCSGMSNVDVQCGQCSWMFNVVVVLG